MAGDRRAPLKAEESIGAVAFEADEVPEYNLVSKHTAACTW